MHELKPRLEQHLANAYVVERELGGGGMAREFLARETALDRQVVIKVLDASVFTAARGGRP
jgi:serine/threonine-protein kinase